MIKKKVDYSKIILDILSEEAPLNPKKIYNILKKEHSYPFRYQSAWLVIKKMTDEGLLFKGETGVVSINTTYMDEQAKKFLKAKEVHFAKSLIDVVDKKGKFKTLIVNVSFEEMESIYHYLITDFVETKLHKKNSWVFFHVRHGYFTFINSSKELSFCKSINEKGIKQYFSIWGNTLLDKWTKQVYGKLNFKNLFVKINNKIPIEDEIWVLPDKVVKLNYPYGYYSFLDSFYKNNTFPLDPKKYAEFMKKMWEMEEKKSIEIIIHNDLESVEKYKNIILKSFNSK